jgi:hypothetical protein
MRSHLPEATQSILQTVLEHVISERAARSAFLDEQGE